MNDILAKLSAGEKLFGLGALVTIVAWVLGLLLSSKSVCYEGFGQKICGDSVNYFTHGHGTDLGLIALIGAIVGIVVLYIKNAPNMKVNWPAPLPVIMLGIAGAVLIAAALAFLLDFLDAKDVMGELPIFFWLAEIGMVVGGALMAWPAYQAWVASK